MRGHKNEKKGEDALRATDDEIKQLFDASPVAMAVSAGVEGRIKAVNRKFTELFGYTIEDLPDVAHWWPLAYPDEIYREEIRSRWEVQVERATRGKGQPEPVEAIVTCKDGSHRYIEFRFSPIGGRLLVTFVDVTERKQVEESLKESEWRYREIFNHVLDTLFLLEVTKDGHFRNLAMNPAIEKSTGIPRSQMIGKLIEEVVPEEVASIVNAKYRHCVEAGQLIEEEVKLDLPAGQRFFHSTLIPARDETGRISRIIGISRDITESKQAEKERLSHLRFFEYMDQVNRAMQGTNDLEQMMRDVLDVLLGIFDCDRAFLTYPCDPEAATWKVPMERFRPEYPGALPIGVEMPLTPDGAEVFRSLLAASGPVQFGPGLEHEVDPDIMQNFKIKSYIAMALYPKVGKPWSFGLHQCSYARVWTLEEQRLLQEVGHRISDALTSLLAYRNLQESEERYRMLFNIMDEGVSINEIIRDDNGDVVDYRILEVNPAFTKNSAFTREQAVGKQATELYDTRPESIRGWWQKHTEMQHVVHTEMYYPPTDRWFHITTTPPQANRFATFSVDITARKKAEVQLLASEQLFRALVENSPDFIARYDREFHRIYVNPAIQKLFGSPPEHVLGKTPAHQSPVYAPQIYIDHLRQVIETGIENATEMPFRTPKGEMHWGHMRFVPEFGPDGKVESVLAIGRDIHEIKENERRFRMLAENFPDFVIRFDRDGRFLYVNPAFEKVLSIRAGSIIGKTLHELLSVSNKEQSGVSLALIRRAFDEGIANESEVRRDTEMGERIFEDRYVPEKDPTGNVVTVLCIARDVTEQKRAEQALRESEWRYHEVFDNVLDGLYMLEVTEDGRFRMMEMNLAVEKITGISRSILIGKTPEEALPAEMAAIVNDKLRHCVAAGQPTEEEAELDLPVGRRYINSTLIPAFEETGKVHRLIGISRDITERKQAENELRQNREATLQFSEQLAALQDVTNELSKVGSFDDLCLQAVQLGRSRMGFDRVSIWFVEEHLGIMRGSFGTDERGELRDERNAQVEFRHEGLTWLLFSRKEPMALIEHRPLYDHLGREVGEGDNAQAALWDGGDVIGVICVDNLLTGQPIRGQQLEVLRLYATTLGHLIRRKRAEEALRESEERYRLLVNLSPDAIGIHGDSGIVFVNPVAVKMLGAKAESDLIGRSIFDFMDSSFQAAAQKALNELQDSSHPTEFAEEKFLRLDGSRFDAEVAGVPFRYQGQHYVQFVARDITERKQHEREHEAIITVSTALRQATTRTEILNVILDQSLELFEADGAVLVLPNSQTGGLIDEMGRGEIGERLTGLSIPLNKGISSWVMTNRKPYLNNNTHLDPLFYRPDLLGDSHCVACSPLIAKEQAIGALWVARKLDLTEQDLRLLNAITDIAANAIHRVMLHEQTEQQLHHLIALHQIDLAISSNFDLDITLKVLLHNVKNELEVNAASILLLDPVTHTLDYGARIGFRTSGIERSHVQLRDEGAGRAAREYRIISYPDLRLVREMFSRASMLTDEDFVSYYAAPLMVKGQVKGVLEVFHRRLLEPEQEWMSYFETLATQAAIALESASLFKNLQRSNLELTLAYDATIEGWSRALDLRDKETEGHTQRVTEMVLKLAEAMGMNDAEKLDIRRGALLHDIGKMGVPDSILHKPGPLSEVELGIIRQHPTYAYQMLSPITYLKHALEIPYCHHEKWNGGGYPRGLKAEQIPLSARMFTVVDVFDALTSNRPYRAAWPREQALAYIKEQSGQYFDPTVVAAFLQML